MAMSGSVLELPRRHETEFRGDAEYSPAVIALCRSSHPAIRRVHCFVRDGVAQLEGRLPTFHQKQLAQEIVRHTEGVRRVENRIVVRDK